MLAVQRHGRKHGEFDCLSIEYRERARQAEAHRADIGIWRIAKLGRAAAKNLGFRQKLDVHFQANDRLILGLFSDGRFGAW